MTEREKQEARREGALALLDVVMKRSDEEWRQEFAAELDRLFPLPADPEEETETVTWNGLRYRVKDERVQWHDDEALGWFDEKMDVEGLLAVAALIQRARDRAWVAEHPEGAVPIPSGGFAKRRAGGKGISVLDIHGHYCYSVEAGVIEVGARLLNASRRTP